MAPHVMNIAHRGAAALWPENTLPAFAAALAAGCDGLEIDVQMTADGVVVIHHDLRLNPAFSRSADGAWLECRQPRISSLSAADIRAVRVGVARPGSTYAQRHADMVGVDTHVPTLAETTDIFGRHAPHDSLLLVELKYPTRKVKTRIDADLLIDRVLDGIDASGLGDRVVFVGFNWNVLLALRRQRPTARIWLTTYPETWFRPDTEPSLPPSAKRLEEMRHLYAEGAPWMGAYWPGNFEGSIPQAIQAAGAEGWLVYGPDAADEDIRSAQSLGLEIGVWGADDAAQLQRFLSLNVNAICTDRPDRLARLQSRPWRPQGPLAEGLRP